MLIRRAPTVKLSEITDEPLYWRRRDFIRTAGTGAALTLLPFDRLPARLLSRRDEDKLTPWEDVTGYNNFYEFGTDKSDPARYATRFRTRPWTVQVAGEVARPAEYDLDDLLRGLTP
jgi:sulfoxide reductase catalytic subunit YedY